MRGPASIIAASLRPTDGRRSTRSSASSILCGFPKDSFFYYKAWWGKEPVAASVPALEFRGPRGRRDPGVGALQSRRGGAAGERQEPGHAKRCRTLGTSSGRFATSRAQSRRAVHKDGKVVMTGEARDHRARRVHPSHGRPHRDQRRRRGPGGSQGRSARQGGPARTDGRATSSASKSPVAGALIGVGNGDPNCQESDKGTEAVAVQWTGAGHRAGGQRAGRDRDRSGFRRPRETGPGQAHNHGQEGRAKACGFLTAPKPEDRLEFSIATVHCRQPLSHASEQERVMIRQINFRDS